MIKQIVKVGNSAGVVLPKSWYGGRVKIELIEKPLDIKKDVLKILEPYLNDIQGVYLTGSYARREQEKDSDVDIIAISEKIRKKITSGKYKIEIYPMKNIKETLKKHPIMFYPAFYESKTIINNALLQKLININLTKKDFKLFYKESKRVYKMDKELIELDKLDGKYLQSYTIVYSSVLRLRALFMIKSILSKRNYSKWSFEKWILNETKISKQDFEKIYQIYKYVRDSKLIKEKIDINVVERVMDFLKKEVDKYDK